MEVAENISRLQEVEVSEKEETGVHLASLRWEEIGPLLCIFIFVVLSGVAKIAFHHAHFISSRVPESCMLVLVGIGFGALIEYGGLTMLPPFTAELFFHYLLPPIIMEAAYSLHHKAFLDNIRAILLFAVLGTAFNFLLIGGLLVAANHSGLMGSSGAAEISINSTHNHNLTAIEIFTFSSLISAVDPVAVLAIFQEIGVNSELYYVVFGESLLNDGVAVVLYNMMIAFAEIQAAGEDVTVIEIILGCASFLTVALGGLCLGVIVGLLTGLLTKTTADVSVIEPLLVIGMALLSYFLAELFHWSGIISLIGCGIVQAHYSFNNISPNSHITVEYFSKMLSSTMDSVIFLYLGKEMLGREETWMWNIHAGFVSWTLVLCLVVRFLGVYTFTLVLNRFRVKPINLQEQFIMAYGGLRGAVGFSLVISIQKSVCASADMLISTTLIVVMFTIWIQGATIKPLVNLLNIDKERDNQKTLMEELNDSVMDSTTNGYSNIIGRYGYQHFLNKFNMFDENYLMKIFCKPGREHDMKRLFEEIVVNEHLAQIYEPQNMSMDLTKLDKAEEQSNQFLNPGFRRDSLNSIISSVSRMSKSVRVSVFEPSTATRRDEDNPAMSILKKGLRQQDSVGVDVRWLRGDANQLTRKLSTSSAYTLQVDPRKRTVSQSSNIVPKF